MKRKLEFTVIEVDVFENLVWTLAYIGVWFFFLASEPTLSKAVFQFATTFVIFVALDNVFRFIMWGIDRL